MDKYTMVVAIVALVMIAGVAKHWLRGQQQNAKKMVDDADEALRHKIDKLEKRIQVLERIATDKGERLRDEIDAL